ncbi:MAG TPA: pyrroline-5-carboxylate reductase [Nitrospiraceae bacterium]|nr:pyrroline-5-carboxylate reductase [Nitrospiraceae bacterium]
MINTNRSGRLALIGGGQMAEALIGGLLAAGRWTPEHIVATDLSQDRRDVLRDLFSVEVGTDNREAVAGAETVILAVKPQVVADVLEELRSCWNHQLVISIAAGIRLAWLRERVPADVRLIRVMPNAPALVGAGMSVLALHQSATMEDERLALGLFESVGRAVVLEEDLMDAVTGLSGSGPAYVCVALEALADGGVKMGLPRASAQRWAAQTAVGAAAWLLAGGTAASRWQETVLADCPPAASGIEALLRAQAGSALINAVAAATRRSRELGA